MSTDSKLRRRRVGVIDVVPQIWAMGLVEFMKGRYLHIGGFF